MGNNNNDEFIYTVSALAVTVDLASRISAGVIRHTCDLDNRDALIEEVKGEIIPAMVIETILAKGAVFHVES